MAAIFCCGFECGQLGAIAGGEGQHMLQTGGANIVTSPVRSGARALRVTPAGTTVGAVATIANSSVVVMRFYVRFATLPSANSFIAMPQFSASTACIFRSSDNTLTTYCNGTYGATGIVVTTGVWYRVDFRAAYSSPNVTVDMQVDGVSASTIVVNPGAAQATTFVRLGTTSAATYDAYYDDFILSITSGDYPFGAGKVEHFVGVSDGAHNVAGANDFERSATGTDIINSTTTAYQLIDDVPLKSGTATEYINLIAPPNATDYVEIVFGPAPGISTPTTGPRCVNAIVAHAAGAAGANNIRIALNDNGTTDDICNGSFHGTVATILYHWKVYTDPPSAASAWTVVSGNGNFNNVRMRCYTSDAAPDPFWASAMIEAEFVEAGAVDAAPGVGVLTVDGFAPTVTASDHQSAAPDVGVLSVTGLEPTAIVDTSVAPDVGALLITGLEPTVTATEHQNIEVPLGALDLTGFAPTVNITDHQNVTPGVGDAIITGFEPTAVASDHINVAPGVGDLTLTGLEPMVSVSDNQNAQPGVGDLVITGLEPTADVTDLQIAFPGVGDLVVTGLEPTAVATAHQFVEPGVGDLLLTGLEPTVAASDHISAAPGVGDLLVTGLEPTAVATEHQSADPGVGDLLITGLQPTVVASDHQVALPDVGVLTLDGFAPTVTASDHQSAAPGVGVLTVDGFSPTVESSISAAPGVGVLTVDGFSPSVDITDHQMVVTDLGVLIITGLEPSVSTGGDTEATPGVGALVITGYAPDVFSLNPQTAAPGFGILLVTGFRPSVVIGAGGSLTVPAGSRERLRVHFRRRQLVNETGNVVVQCNPDGTAVYVPGDVDQTWEEFTQLVTGLDKLSLSWDKSNSGKSGESTDTNSGGSNYDKGISASVTVNDEAFQFIYDWLVADPCGTLNSVEVMITDELCNKRYRTFEIKTDNLNYSPYGAPCEFEVKLREMDPIWHCVHKTFIWDNWQDWFVDGSSKQHPCFLTGVESRPRLLASARMGLSIFGRSIPILSAIFNENDNAFRRIQNVDNFVDAPLVRDFISNVADKCGLSVDTMFHDPENPYYDLCLYYPLSGAIHTNDSSAVTSPSLAFHFENRWNITLAELLDKLKVVFKAEWYVTPNNTLVFKPKAEFLDLINSPIIDFTLPENAEIWDKYSLNYGFNGNKKPAYGRYQYAIDASDLASQEAQPLHNDIVDFDGPANNLMLEGHLSNQLEFASTGAIRDGRAKQDYLRETVSEGETVAYAMVILVAVVIAALFAGVVTVGAATALAAFLAIWAAAIASKANALRTLFGSATYTGAVRLTSEQVATPRLLLWDGVSLNRAKMQSVAVGAILPDTFYNPDSEDYDDRNKFQYAPAGVFNYPMFFDSYFQDNLFDRFHDSLDNPLKSMESHQTFDLDAYLCCDLLDTLGVWEDQFAKIGYFVKLEERDGYDVLGRIEHFDINHDDEIVHLRGQVYKVKT